MTLLIILTGIQVASWFVAWRYGVDFGAEIEFFYGKDDGTPADIRELIAEKGHGGEVRLSWFGVLVGEAVYEQGEINTTPCRTPLGFLIRLIGSWWMLSRLFPDGHRAYFQNRWPFSEYEPTSYEESERYRAIDAATMEYAGVRVTEISGRYSAFQIHIRWHGYDDDAYFTEFTRRVFNAFVRSRKIDNYLARIFDPSYRKGEGDRHKEVWDWAIRLGLASAETYASVDEMKSRWLSMKRLIKKKNGSWCPDFHTKYKTTGELLEEYFHYCVWPPVRHSPADPEGKSATIEVRIFRSMRLSGLFFAFCATYVIFVKTALQYAWDMRHRPIRWRPYNS